jgi:hypothetical protein
MSFSCQYPGEQSGEIQCENAINNVLLGHIAGGVLGSVTNWETVAKGIVGMIVAAGLLQGSEALAAIAAVFASPWVAGTVLFLAFTETILAFWGVFQDVAQQLCMPWNGNQELALIGTAGSDPEYPLQFLTAAPMSTISGTIPVYDPTDTTCETTCPAGLSTCATYTTCQGNSQCSCGTTTENANYCFISILCSTAQTCTASTDCPDGAACLQANCCGYSVCNPPCPGASLPAAKRSLPAIFPRLASNTSGLLYSNGFH